MRQVVRRGVPVSRTVTNVVGLVVTTAKVVRLHLEKVKRLLTDTDWNLSQIAEKMGFNYVEYLHTVFT